ncbi:NAD(P)H-hydrate dehydratase [Roseovarius pelagicus]|uniref:Bifunctional NAD(P)H-hydrate repair enzyme n=1 Tax=Roseovarius pelagicus TaxID=2980108 RepID=A0ABY6D9J0_9RHOB|nr:NAD(P)H-hydrate dehydratase [Roseovarius pelagicus]UXX82763.1 NAD(P)H-hydrate dehydratase [Roseovarius pelagicus]
MTELLTGAQMRAIEMAAIESGEVTGLDLMERAGRGVVEAVFEEWPALAATSHRAVVLCGPGNNGGDGFVVARLLREWGWEVELFLFGDVERLPPDARVNYERWLTGGGTICPLDDVCGGLGTRTVALVVDALFGTGLSRPLNWEVEQPLSDVECWKHRHEKWPATVAIDLPSGLCADSGQDLGARLPCDLTVTFHTAKPGHFLGEGPQYCGAVRIVDIGLPERPTGSRRPDDVVGRVGSPLGLFKNGAHKFAHGHALVLSGGSGTTGAARLAARGALRIGAGLVTLGVPPSAQMEVASQITAVMLKRVLDAAALADILQDARINALCLGPGMGVAWASDMLGALRGEGDVEPRPTVLDADALTALAEDEALFAALHPACVLTPHQGEFARLFPDIAKRLREESKSGPAYSKADAVRAAAARAGCVVLLKGPDTVISDPKGRCSVHSAQYDRAAPWLATAGSGDVLAGFITGLLARGFAPMQAAEAAAWLHTECARSFGAGLIAEDIPEELPRVLRALGI